jgi:hypothetical protein
MTWFASSSSDIIPAGIIAELSRPQTTKAVTRKLRIATVVAFKFQYLPTRWLPAGSSKWS